MAYIVVKEGPNGLMFLDAQGAWTTTKGSASLFNQPSELPDAVADDGGEILREIVYVDPATGDRHAMAVPADLANLDAAAVTALVDSATS